MVASVLLRGLTHLAMLRVLKAIRNEELELIRVYLGPRLGLIASPLMIILSPKPDGGD